MEIIQFFFCNLWHFIGLIIIILLIGEIILKLAYIISCGNSSSKDKEESEEAENSI